MVNPKHRHKTTIQRDVGTLAARTLLQQDCSSVHAYRFFPQQTAIFAALVYLFPLIVCAYEHIFLLLLCSTRRL